LSALAISGTQDRVRTRRSRARRGRRDDPRSYRFVNYTAVLSDPDGFLQNALSCDGVHPNEAGYLRMMPVLERALAVSEIAHRPAHLKRRTQRGRHASFQPRLPATL